MIACLRLPDIPPNDHRIDGVMATLAELTPNVESEGDGLVLRADARNYRQHYVVPHSQLDEMPSAMVYADLGKMPTTEGLDAATSIYRLVKDRTECRSAVALAAGKFPARTATLALNTGEVAVLVKEVEAVLLAPYPVSLLPVDGETLRQLDLLGLHTLGDITRLSQAALADRFGTTGQLMHRLASGRDTTPVAPYLPRQQEITSHQFEPPVTDRTTLVRIVEQLAADTSAHLKKHGLAANRILLTLTLESGRTWEQEIALRQPTSQALYLSQAAAGLMPEYLPEAVSHVELCLDDIRPVTTRQLSLFERQPVSRARLREVLKALVARYGDESFYWASLVTPEPGPSEPRYQWRKFEEQLENGI